MELVVKDIDITTGGPLVAILNREDAQKLDLHVLDRIKIRKNNRYETVVLDIAETPKSIKPGQIGLFEEVMKSLKLKNKEKIKIIPAKKPKSIQYIRKKLDGGILKKHEIDQIVWDITHNKLSQIELTYFVAACYTNVMTIGETIMLTKSIVKHGESLKLKEYPIIDKHCIGGLAGNRTTMIIVPIVAAAGYVIPKTSSRSITSPAGTADTMEVLANVSYSIKHIKKLVNKNNGCIIWGGGLNLAPADDKIIFVERPLGIDAESQLLASIMAKKHSVSSTHILIDIPVGKDAKIKNLPEAKKLKSDFLKIGKSLKKKVKVIITKGECPIGNGIGPALEARDVLWVLSQDDRRPLDLEKKSLMLASEIFKMVGMKNSLKKARQILRSGIAYKKMIDIIKTQKGSIITPGEVPLGEYTYDVISTKTGIIKEINNSKIIKLARVAGAPVNKGAGIYMHKQIRSKIKKGDILFTIYAESKQKLKYAKEVLKEQHPYIIK